RCRAVRATAGADFPGPRALGHRLAAPQHEDAHAGRRQARRLRLEDRADTRAATEAAGRQSVAPLLELAPCPRATTKRSRTFLARRCSMRRSRASAPT